MDVYKDNDKMLVPAAITVLVASWLSALLIGQVTSRPTYVYRFLILSQRGYKNVKWSLAIKKKSVSSTLQIKARKFSVSRSKFLRS